MTMQTENWKALTKKYLMIKNQKDQRQNFNKTELPPSQQFWDTCYLRHLLLPLITQERHQLSHPTSLTIAAQGLWLSKLRELETCKENNFKTSTFAWILIAPKAGIFNLLQCWITLLAKFFIQQVIPHAPMQPCFLLQWIGPFWLYASPKLSLQYVQHQHMLLSKSVHSTS